MDRLATFVANNPVLCGIFVALLIALLVTEVRRARRGWREIGNVELTRLLNGGEATLVDLSPPGDYEKGHILHARNHPLAQLVVDHKDFKARDRQLILVCRDGIKSASAAERFVQAGFPKVAVLRNGLNGWLQDQLPLAKGKR